MTATYLAQIAPQRSTQYTALASALAPHELILSPLGHLISSISTLELGGQAYLKIEMKSEPDAGQVRELGMLAMTSAFFQYYERLGEYGGPLLRPIDACFEPSLPPDLAMTRRYRGKTNELFTLFLCNVARFSSGFSRDPWSGLRVFDPLAGGGTTLFTALTLGADAAGVERKAQDVQSTAAFLRRYMREQGISCDVREERLRKVGRRWSFTIGKGTSQRCLLACGDTLQSVELLTGFKTPHLIVTDLPYGIQHHGELNILLTKALPVWASTLSPQGAIAFAWESTRFSRTDMIALVESESPLAVLNEPPYNQLAHRVDRVIKQRDVLVAHLS